MRITPDVEPLFRSYPFDDQTWRIVTTAYVESERYVGIGHLLLILLMDEQVRQVLANYVPYFSLERLSDEVDFFIFDDQGAEATTLDFTDAALEAFDLAQRHAEEAKQLRIRPIDLLIGIFKAQKNEFVVSSLLQYLSKFFSPEDEWVGDWYKAEIFIHDLKIKTHPEKQEASVSAQ